MPISRSSASAYLIPKAARARRGLVVRDTEPANRRCKGVSWTDAGRDRGHALATTDEPAPEMLSGLDEAELRKLQAILVKLAGD